MFDLEYSEGVKIGEIQTIEGITNNLIKEIAMFNDVPMTLKSYFIEKYINGTICAVNQKPREVTIFYYCDYFNTTSEFTMLEISEPDWCKYHVKVATKYLCGKGNVNFSYDSKRGRSHVECLLSSL